MLLFKMCVTLCDIIEYAMQAYSGTSAVPTILNPYIQIVQPTCISNGTILAACQSRQTPDYVALGKAWGMSLRQLAKGACSTSEAACYKTFQPLAIHPKTWDGDHIICLGDYHEDLPAGMLSTSEQGELDKAGDKEEGGQLYAFTAEQYQYVKGQTVHPFRFNIYSFLLISVQLINTMCAPKDTE
jgi:hypothetical protein